MSASPAKPLIETTARAPHASPEATGLTTEGPTVPAAPPWSTHAEAVSVRGTVFFSVLVAVELLWFFNAIVKWYPFTVFAPGGDESALHDLFRYANSVAMVLCMVWLFRQPIARRFIPWPELFYGAFTLTLLVTRADPFFEMRSTVPLAFLAVVPFWLGRYFGNAREYHAAVISRFADLISIVLAAGLLVWLVVPDAADWRGLTGGRSYVFFTQFLGPVHAFVLLNAIELRQHRIRRLLRIGALLITLGLTALTITRSEFVPALLVCVAVFAVRPVWWFPLAAAATYLVLANEDVAQSLRFADERNVDLTNGRGVLVDYLWRLFLENPAIGVGRTVAGQLARIEFGQVAGAASVEHGFVMHLAASGVAGGLYVLTLVARSLRVVGKVQFVSGWSKMPRTTKVLLSSSASLAAGSILYGATGGFAAGSAFTDSCYLMFIGFAYGITESTLVNRPRLSGAVPHRASRAPLGSVGALAHDYREASA